MLQSPHGRRRCYRHHRVTDLDSRVAGPAAGAADFFGKPFDVLDLRAWARFLGGLRRGRR